MREEQILARPSRYLRQSTREFYFEQGYLLVEGVIGDAWLCKLRAAIDRLIERSREVSSSDRVFDIEPGHTRDEPRLRRVSSPCDQDPVFWEFLISSCVGDVLEDVLGPDVKFYQSKVNFKWPRGGTEVRWHQDAPFFPHTNSSVLTCGLYLEDCKMDQGPLAVIAGSHKGPLFDHYNEQGIWTGEIRQADMESVALDSVEYLCGPAGSITLHNCRTVHGSQPNLSDRGRPLLLNVVSSADAMPYTPNPLPSQYAQSLIRGQPARWAHHENGEYLIPPDWSGGYSSIFSLQQREGNKSVAMR